MKLRVIKKYHVVVILAVLFLVSGWYASRSYSQYRINVKKLDILRSQERHIKKRIKTFDEKKAVLAQVNDFVKRAGQWGVAPKNWDGFKVNLQDTGMSFSAFQDLLDQANTRPEYYFIPKSLWVRTGNGPPLFASESNIPTKKNEQEADPVSGSGNAVDSDVMVSLEGRFLVRHNRGDNG